MILYVEKQSEDENEYQVSIGNKTVKINDILPKSEWNLEENREYEIVIEQVEYKTGKADIIFHVLTIFIQGLYHILLMNVDENLWYKNFFPYKVKGTIQYHTKNIQKDSIIFSCKKPTYDMGKPRFWVKGNREVQAVFSKSIQPLKNEYFRYMQKVTSTYSIFYVFFFVLLCSGLKDMLLGVTVAISGIIVFFSVVLIWRVMKEYHRYRKIKNKLESDIAIDCGK